MTYFLQNSGIILSWNTARYTLYILKYRFLRRVSCCKCQTAGQMPRLSGHLVSWRCTVVAHAELQHYLAAGQLESKLSSCTISQSPSLLAWSAESSHTVVGWAAASNGGDLPAEVFAARKTIWAAGASKSATVSSGSFVFSHHPVTCQRFGTQWAYHLSRRRDPGAAALRDYKDCGRQHLCHGCHPLGGFKTSQGCPFANLDQLETWPTRAVVFMLVHVGT